MNPLSEVTNQFGLSETKGVLGCEIFGAKTGKYPASQDELVILFLS